MTGSVRVSRPVVAIAAWVVVGAVAPGAAVAQQREQANPAIARGVAYLKSQVSGLDVGKAALVALALNKADVPNEDPAIQACLRRVLPQFTAEGYSPEKRGGHDVYETAVVIMALANLDPVAYKPQVEAAARYLIQIQKPNGSWDYEGRTAGDTSMAQYALLGLWEADGVGVEVPPQVWDAAALWFISAQFPSGGWNYHIDQNVYLETVSMTAAGVGSLMLCQRMLAPYRKGFDTIHPLLTPLIVEGGDLASKFRPVSTTQAVNVSMNRGIEWLARNYAPAETPLMGQSTYYGLYGMERTGALAQGDKLKPLGNWYERGFQFTLGGQSGDGSWNSRDVNHGVPANTSWAVLYLTRATAKSVRKIEIRKLGAGTLLGGRDLPSDLNNMTIAQGRVVVRPMNGAVEGMIAVLEDPRSTEIGSALAGLIARYTESGPDVLRPYKDRFRKLLADRDPGLRRVACWALGRTSDIDVAVDLIRTLLDPDEAVAAEARVSLELLSRKLTGYGPPRGATVDQRLEAAKKWRDWYEAVRPSGLETIDDGTLQVLANRLRSVTTAAAAAGGGS
jgi:hypothetical protein